MVDDTPAPSAARIPSARRPAGVAAAPAGPSEQDLSYLAALRSGDEAVISELVRSWGPMLLRTAVGLVRDRSVAEEVVQETWVVVLEKHTRFQGRSSLRTWVVGTLINVARRRRERELRTIPVGTAHDLPQPRTGGPWSAGAWSEPEAGVLARELSALVDRALLDLPPAQRRVVHLRDVVGLDAADVCRRLDLSGPNQRVVLHRGRRRVRTALAAYVQDDRAEGAGD